MEALPGSRAGTYRYVYNGNVWHKDVRGSSNRFVCSQRTNGSAPCPVTLKMIDDNHGEEHGTHTHLKRPIDPIKKFEFDRNIKRFARDTHSSPDVIVKNVSKA